MMDKKFEDRWLRAKDGTKLHRTRQTDLFTFGTTALPYVFIASSAINTGDSMLRRGELKTEKPAIIWGGGESSDSSRFHGFEDEGQDDNADRVLFARAFRFPNLQVNNQGMELEVVSREMTQLSDELMTELEANGDRRTAVIEGPEDLWGLSLLIYAAEMTQRSAPGNLRDITERRGGPSFR
jgi:hypothetical protein